MNAQKAVHGPPGSPGTKAPRKSMGEGEKVLSCHSPESMAIRAVVTTVLQLRS